MLIPTTSPLLQVANGLLRLFMHPALRPSQLVARRFDPSARRVVRNHLPRSPPQLMQIRMLNCDTLVVFRLSQDRKRKVSFSFHFVNLSL